MAEFQEVMKQAKRMCEAQNDCEKCPIFEECDGSGYVSLDCTADAEVVERKIMGWAEKNQEARYPSWSEAWRRLFPGARYTPCPESEFGIKMECKGGCKTCLDKPIPADVAEKLRIKPIGGKDDEEA